MENILKELLRLQKRIIESEFAQFMYVNNIDELNGENCKVKFDRKKYEEQYGKITNTERSL